MIYVRGIFRKVHVEVQYMIGAILICMSWTGNKRTMLEWKRRLIRWRILDNEYE